MASSIASPIAISAARSLGRGKHKPNNRIETSVDKTGGILCHLCITIFDNRKDYESHYIEHKTGEAEIVYTCVSCKKQVPGYSSFRNHCYLSHVVRNKFQCQYCQKKFSKLNVLKSHISLVHEFKCSLCDDKFECKKELETHKNLHHLKLEKGKNAPPYNCVICKIKIETLSQCELHFEEHSEMRYPCPICETLLPDKQPAIQHLTVHFNETSPTQATSDYSSREDSSVDILGGILCCICDKIFRNRAEIDSHFVEEHNDRTISYSCNVCSKSFEKYYLFGSHCYNHYSKDRFECDQCNKLFPRLSLLVMHMEMFHMSCTAEKPFHCKDCGRGFFTCLRLHEHRRIVHGEEENMYRCTKPGCNEAFGKPRELMAHVRLHGSALDRWCRACGLHFPTLRSAERHLAVHRRAHYSCPVCARAYREKYLMVKHVAVHFESVFHVCNICGKAYGARHRLVEHAKIHSAARPHACPHCDKAFLSRLALQQHLNTHTGSKPYLCTACPKTFASYPNWRKHLNRIHGVDAATIRQLFLDKYQPEPEITSHIPHTSPSKAESGIESAGSELSDVYAFASDDSSDIKDWNAHKSQTVERTPKAKKKPVAPNKNLSIAETVRLCIDSLDDNIDSIKSVMKTPEYEPLSDFNMGDNADDGSDIRAIVEQIDALSEEMEAGGGTADNSRSGDTPDNSRPGDTPAALTESDLFSAVTGALQAVEEHHASDYQPQYGPDFTADTATSGEDHLPHINPLLTIAPNDDKKYVQNTNNLSYPAMGPMEHPARLAWPAPIITKVFQYEEKDDANRIYTIYY